MTTLTIKPMWNREKKLNREGKALVQMRFIYQRKRKLISTGIYLTPNQWDNQRLRVKNHPNKHQLNTFLINVEQKANNYFYTCFNENRAFTFDGLVDFLSGRNKDFISFFEHAIKDYSTAKPQTIKLYSNALRLLKIYAPELSFNALNYEFINGFENWLKNRNKEDKNGYVKIGEKLSEGYIYNIMNSLRIFIKEAIKNDLMVRNPFDKKRMSKPNYSKTYLTLAELKTIENCDSFQRVNLEVLGAFLLQCYTGLRFSDIERLAVKHINQNWLEITTKKTGTLVKIPLDLLFEGKGLIIVKSHIQRKKGETKLFKLPRIENYLKHLKRIAHQCGIHKNITSHVGRNSFAKILRNDYQIPIGIIKELLGHKTLAMSETYATISKKGISAAIQVAINEPVLKQESNNRHFF